MEASRLLAGVPAFNATTAAGESTGSIMLMIRPCCHDPVE
jgi:hypothetical protein